MSYTVKANTTAEYNSFEILKGNIDASAAIQKIADFDIIASSPSLSAADSVITETGKEYRLKEALENVKLNYDYVIIDTPPSLGILTVNALAACTGVIIPSQADIYSLQGIGQFFNTVTTVKKYCNPELKIMGIVLTRFNPRTIISRDVEKMVENIAERIQTKLYKTKIRECTAIKESQISQSDIFTYAPESNAAEDYKKLANEIISKI